VRDLDASDRQFDDLAPLARVLSDTRVVLLGEPSHLDGAAFDAKVRLIEFLHEQLGFDLLAWEAGMWSCEQMDARVRQPAGEADPRELGLGWPWAGVQQTKAIFDYARRGRYWKAAPDDRDRRQLHRQGGRLSLPGLARLVRRRRARLVS
jgi:erythromycin esterase